jgi:cobalamin biosynthesis protein CobD/CbiB
MEVLAIAIPVIPIGAVAGYILARLTSPAVTIRVVAALAAIALALLVLSRMSDSPNAVGYPILAFAIALPLALGGALGAALERARRRFGPKE